MTDEEAIKACVACSEGVSRADVSVEVEGGPMFWSVIVSVHHGDGGMVTRSSRHFVKSAAHALIQALHAEKERLRRIIRATPEDVTSLVRRALLAQSVLHEVES